MLLCYDKGMHILNYVRGREGETELISVGARIAWNRSEIERLSTVESNSICSTLKQNYLRGPSALYSPAFLFALCLFVVFVVRLASEGWRAESVVWEKKENILCLLLCPTSSPCFVFLPSCVHLSPSLPTEGLSWVNITSYLCRAVSFAVCFVVVWLDGLSDAQIILERSLFVI